jgi:hypothetical protein
VALAALSADALREVVREMLLQLDDKARNSAIHALIERAARGGSGWAPAALRDDEVTDALAFARAAVRAGRAEPSDVDEHLRRASGAFLQKDYSAAHRIFAALLLPIADVDIDLGQDELVDEVLGTDAAACPAQYAVSTYMLSPPAERAGAVLAAIQAVRGLGHFWEPLGELERVAVEPLPGLDGFLPAWRALLEQRPAGRRGGHWDSDEDRWLREVVQRLDGSDGLAKIARTTKRADDLRAWCASLVDAGDWEAALPAFEEAAGLVADQDYARGELLDGAALAAQRLGRTDLSAWLERAWRAGPTMLRLRRWLGSARTNAALRRRASEALLACPNEAARQRAFLHLPKGEIEPAAELLAAAPGLGWSDGEHPGHLLFPLFAWLLGGKKPPSQRTALMGYHGMDLDALEAMTADDDEPRLAAPDVEQLLESAGVTRIPNPEAQRAVALAMREATETRLAGVTEQKRRRHYGHAAQLVRACVVCDPSADTARWVAALRVEHKRFHALRAELDRALAAR